MAAYHPTPINDGDPFDPLVVRDNFDKLSSAINCDLNENNLLSGRRLEHRSFHKNSVSSVFTNSSSDTAVFMLFPRGGTLYGESTNEYDVDDCALRFYLHEQSDLFFFANIQINSGMHNWKSLSSIGYSASDLQVRLWAAMYFDGAKQHHQNTTPVVDQTSLRVLNDINVHADVSPMSNDDRGSGFFIHGTRLSVPAGAHTIKAKLVFDCTGGTGSLYNPTPHVTNDGCASQYYSKYRSITVIANHVLS